MQTSSGVGRSAPIREYLFYEHKNVFRLSNILRVFKFKKKRKIINDHFCLHLISDGSHIQPFTPATNGAPEEASRLVSKNLHRNRFPTISAHQKHICAEILIRTFDSKYYRKRDKTSCHFSVRRLLEVTMKVALPVFCLAQLQLASQCGFQRNSQRLTRVSRP